jgi:AAA+ ATPase superfamily predicted ATPase
MEFVGRHEEMERLNALYKRPKGGLAVLTGRRRIGKTRLLVEWNRRDDGVYTVADQSSPDIQRRYFCEALSARFPVFAEATFRDWRAILRTLAQQAKAEKWRGPLILDEFPFLVSSSPELPSVVQHWLDHDAPNACLVVAIAGSSQRMMHGLVLDSGAPLYGRAAEMSDIKPLCMADFTTATGVTDPITCVKAFVAWGGVPRYWELAEPYAARVGLVKRESPFGESEKSGKRALYEIADPFMRLWFRIVAPHRALLAQAPATVRRDLWGKERPGLCSAAWEELCRKSVALAGNPRSTLAKKGPWMPAARYWHGKGTEWDVVSRSIDGKRGLLGEVKWSEKTFRKGDLGHIATELRRKGVPPLLEKVPEIVYCLFVPKAEEGVRKCEGMLVLNAEFVAAAGT